MKTTTYRIAAVVFILLVLAGADLWWRHGRPLSEAMAAQANLKAASMGAAARLRPASPHSDDGEAAATAEDERCAQDTKAVYAALFEELGDRHDPDAMIVRATLALMLQTDEHGVGGSPRYTRSALMAAASAEHPDNPDIAWYRAKHCFASEGCDRGAAIDRLLVLEPDNLAGWLLALREAQGANNEVAVQTTLDAAAKAGYYDSRMGDTFLRVHGVLKERPWPASCMTPGFLREWANMARSDALPTPSDTAAITAVALASAEMPAYAAVRDACIGKQGAALPQARSEACRSVFGKIADGDMLIDRMIGDAMMVQLTAGTAEHEHWRERYRQARWLMANQQKLESDFPHVMRRWTEGEVRVMQQELAARNLWPAPSDWLPEQEH